MSEPRKRRALSLFQRAWLWMFSPIALVLLLTWLVGTGLVQDGTRQALGGCLFLPVMVLFGIPALLGGSGFFEIGIGAAPNGASGWVFVLVFWGLVCAGAAGLMAGLSNRKNGES